MKGAISSFFLIPLASVGSVNAVLPRARSIPVPCRSSSRNSRYAYPRVYGFARAQGTSDRNITLPRRHPPSKYTIANRMTRLVHQQRTSQRNFWRGRSRNEINKAGNDSTATVDPVLIRCKLSPRSNKHERVSGTSHEQVIGGQRDT